MPANRGKFFIAAATLLVSKLAVSQAIVNDTAYYETFPDKLTTRIYLAQKFLKLNIAANSSSNEDLEYKANTHLNLGMGVTYRKVSLNVFYGFRFLNRDDEKGATKGLDLQLHFYPRRWAVDLVAVFPRGYYLSPKGYGSADPEQYYKRPDMKIALVGLSAYQVANKEQFSYRAAVTQNEWQKKSAGSFLYGGTAHHGVIQADSALVPSRLVGNFKEQGINKITFTAIGAGAGYAYTLVIRKHFYITASVIANGNLDFVTEENQGHKGRKTSFDPNLIFKGGLGYNSDNWNVSVNSLGATLWTHSVIASSYYYIPLGVIRLVVSKKINLHRRK